MLKIGDWVYLNPKYCFPSKIDIIKGIISAETVSWNSACHIIYWEDGKKGNVYLDKLNPCLLLV